MSQISVIIPVYNAASFLSKAIASALAQTGVHELIVIDDGSTDNSFAIASDLAAKDQRIKLHQHLDLKNHGRSASRNLGIRLAVSPFIAFLDADDFYLPNRFVNDLKILEQYPDADGVYNAISAYFYREATETEVKKLKLTTVRELLKPETLFENMGPIGHYGYFSGIGLTVKKTIFDKVGFFNENLEVAEDTELWLKMSLVTKLLPGNIQAPVAMRGVHETNSSFKDEILYKQCYAKMFQALFVWSLSNQIPFGRQLKLWKNLWFFRNQIHFLLGTDLKIWFGLILRQPRLLFHPEGYKRNPLLYQLKKSI